ncbi:hypothetical protein ABBQ32_008777 [Trebouxia sp. C0010 RCD-2024]
MTEDARLAHSHSQLCQYTRYLMSVHKHAVFLLVKRDKLLIWLIKGLLQQHNLGSHRYKTGGGKAQPPTVEINGAQHNMVGPCHRTHQRAVSGHVQTGLPATKYRNAHLPAADTVSGCKTYMTSHTYTLEMKNASTNLGRQPTTGDWTTAHE